MLLCNGELPRITENDLKSSYSIPADTSVVSVIGVCCVLVSLARNQPVKFNAALAYKQKRDQEKRRRRIKLCGSSFMCVLPILGTAKTPTPSYLKVNCKGEGSLDPLLRFYIYT